jgi:hypothetical protein
MAGFKCKAGHGAQSHFIIEQVLFLWERLPMATEAFGEGRQPRSFRGMMPLPQKKA